MNSLKNQFLDIFKISAPMIVGNLGHFLTGGVDVFVAAKHSINTLSAIAIANSILFTLFLIGIGALTGISIVLSNYRGEDKATKKYFIPCVIISLIYALITFLLIIISNIFVPIIGYSESLVKDIQNYMFIVAFSMFGMFVFQGIKEFLQAHEIVKFPNMILLLMVFLNLILNFVFVFGIGFIPSLGILGLAYSTLIVRTLMGIILFIYAYLYVKRCSVDNSKINLNEYCKNVIKIGLPVGISVFLECAAFNIITLIIGVHSELLAATHNILIILIDAAFMVPLSISSAVSIKVGYYNGAKDFEQIKKYSLVGICMAIFFMIIFSISFVSFPRFFIGIFTMDKQILEVAVPIVILIACFEVVDGIQTTLGGVLKGLKMTKQVTYCMIGAYWFIGMPLGYYFAFEKKLYLQGFWYGLTFALLLMAITEFIIIVYAFKRLKKTYAISN